MELLLIDHSDAKPNRYYIDGRRVDKSRYWAAIDRARISGKRQQCFHSRTSYDAAGNATRRQYSQIS